MRAVRNQSAERGNATTPTPPPTPTTPPDELVRAMMYDSELSIENVRNASAESLRWSRRQFFIFRHTIVVTCSLGVVLTFCVLLIILANRKFRSTPNLFHVNLFLSNLGVMVTGLVFELPVLVLERWPFGDGACLVNLQLRRMFFAITQAHFALMALNRLFAICMPSRRFLVSRTAFVVKSVLGYGVPAAIYALTTFWDPMKGGRIVYNGALDTCVLVTKDAESIRRRRMLLSTLMGVLPIVPSIVCYACILVRVRRMRRELRGFSDAADAAGVSGNVAARHFKQELYIAKTAAATFCFYALTVTLPYVSYGLTSTNGIPKYVNLLSLVWLGIALQPITFFATNRKFRKHACALMCCREPPDADTTGSLRTRTARTSSSVSRPSRLSFADLRSLISGTVGSSAYREKGLKERGDNKSTDNLPAVCETQEPMTPIVITSSKL